MQLACALAWARLSFRSFQSLLHAYASWSETILVASHRLGHDRQACGWAARTEASVAAAQANAMASRRRRDAAQATTQAQRAQARVEVGDTLGLPPANNAWRGGAQRVSLSGVEYNGVRARPKCCAS
jgi:hypothetical protein